MTRGATDAAMTVLAGRALLARAASALGAEGIVPLVLKGVLISALSEGWGLPPRTMVDVDLLVRPADRARAEGALAAMGLERVARITTATTFHDHRTGLAIDLHAHLVEPELFRFDSEGVIARSHEDRALFGFLVRVPDRADLYAHLVAHFARNRSNAEDTRRLADFAVVARALPLDARSLAEHLRRCGLARAARYALPLAARRGDAFAAEVLRELPPDLLGDAIARGAERWLARFPESSPLAIPALHALNASIPRGARSLTLHAARGLARRVQDHAP